MIKGSELIQKLQVYWNKLTNAYKVLAVIIALIVILLPIAVINNLIADNNAEPTFDGRYFSCQGIGSRMVFPIYAKPNGDLYLDKDGTLVGPYESVYHLKLAYDYLEDCKVVYD